MSTEALKGLDVGRIAHRDAALFMWATDAHIPDALELYRAWGFRYVTVAFVWSKKTVNGKTVSNLAPWTLKNCELSSMASTPEGTRASGSGRWHTPETAPPKPKLGPSRRREGTA